MFVKNKSSTFHRDNMWRVEDKVRYKSSSTNLTKVESIIDRA
jgi:hypothetical protein